MEMKVKTSWAGSRPQSMFEPRNQERLSQKSNKSQSKDDLYPVQSGDLSRSEENKKKIMSKRGFYQSREQNLASDFVSQLSLGSDTDSQLLCQPCQLDDQSIPAYGYCQTCAEHLCQLCYQTHCKPAPLRNHILLDKTQMPQTQGSGINKEETCEFHRGKAIEYFCQDHQVLGCSPCITINHRGCSKIDYIPEAADDFNNSTEYRQLLSDIDDLKTQGETLKMSTTKDQGTILQRKDAIKQEIRAFRKECLKKIKAWENTLMQQNDTLHDAEYAKSTTVADESVKTIETVTKLQANLETLQNSGNQSTLFIQAKKSARTVQTMMTNIEQCKNNNQIQEYTLVKNQNIQGMFQSQTNLGHLSRNQRMFQNATPFYSVASNNNISLNMGMQYGYQHPYAYQMGNLTPSMYSKFQ